MQTKPFWQSKTLWVNFIGLIIVVLQYAGTINVIDPKILAFTLGIINMILRLVTNTGVTLT